MALTRVGAGRNLTFIIYIPFCQHMGNQIIIINSSEDEYMMNVKLRPKPTLVNAILGCPY